MLLIVRSAKSVLEKINSASVFPAYKYLLYRPFRQKEIFTANIVLIPHVIDAHNTFMHTRITHLKRHIIFSCNLVLFVKAGDVGKTQEMFSSLTRIHCRDVSTPCTRVAKSDSKNVWNFAMKAALSPIRNYRLSLLPSLFSIPGPQSLLLSFGVMLKYFKDSKMSTSEAPFTSKIITFLAVPTSLLLFPLPPVPKNARIKLFVILLDVPGVLTV